MNDNELEIIPYDSCEEETGVSYEELLQLTGVYGIHSEDIFFEMLDNRLIDFWIGWNSTNQLTVIIKSPPRPGETVIKELTVIIRSPDEIYNATFILHPYEKNTNNNYGFKRLKNELQAAPSFSIKKITLWAYGDIKMIKDWNGYLIWSKYGFVMYEAEEIANFRIQMGKDRLGHCDTINKLTCSKEGTAYWKHTGWSWHGEFLLNNGVTGESWKIFYKYGRERNLT